MDKATASGQPAVAEESSPVPDFRKLPDGQYADHWVLSKEERMKGFVRPVRHAYIHEKCGTETRMGTSIAESYAREPAFYGSTFCSACGAYFPVGADGEFVWADAPNEKVGT